MSKYNINFYKKINENDWLVRIVYGKISTADLCDIFIKKGLCKKLYDELNPNNIVFGTVTFEFNKDKDECESLYLEPTYYDKETDSYWNEDSIDVDDIFKDRIEDALKYLKEENIGE